MTTLTVYTQRVRPGDLRVHGDSDRQQKRRVHASTVIDGRVYLDFAEGAVVLPVGQLVKVEREGAAR